MLQEIYGYLRSGSNKDVPTTVKRKRAQRDVQTAKEEQEESIKMRDPLK